MSDTPTDSAIPWLPEGHTLVVPGRGELFYRFHRHADPEAPIALLLHGWTASGDLQFFTAYKALAAQYSFITFDYRGHGRGLRLQERFELEDVADDAAALLESLGVAPVIAVGYSMGGPVGMLLARRHPHLVRAIVMEATALGLVRVALRPCALEDGAHHRTAVAIGRLPTLAQQRHPPSARARPSAAGLRAVAQR